MYVSAYLGERNKGKISQKLNLKKRTSRGVCRGGKKGRSRNGDEDTFLKAVSPRKLVVFYIAKP